MIQSCLMPSLLLSLHLTGCASKCESPSLTVYVIDGTGAPAPADNLWAIQDGVEVPADVCTDHEPDTGATCVKFVIFGAHSGECTLRVEYEGMEATTTIEAEMWYHSSRRHCQAAPDQVVNFTVPWSFE